MAIPTLMELAEAGAHYGHHRSMTFPKAKNFIFMVKNNVSLINLEETRRCLEEAQTLLHQYKSENRTILFVGTKRSIRNIVKEAAKSFGAPYITERWYGGFLTNFPNFATQLKKMKELAEYLEGEKIQKLDKKQRARIQTNYDHTHRFLGGAADLAKLPELLIVGSATEDKIAMGEAKKLGIPVIAIIDTDINPNEVEYPIPANDDAPRAVELIFKSLVEEPSSKKVAKPVKAQEPTTTGEEQGQDEVVEKPKKAKATQVKKADVAVKPKKPVTKKTVTNKKAVEPKKAVAKSASRRTATPKKAAADTTKKAKAK